MHTKDPHNMSLDELKLLLEIRRLELINSFQDVTSRLGIGARILRSIKKSGIIDKLVDSIQSKSNRGNSSSDSRINS